MYFLIVKTHAGWHARICGANHEIVFTTQVYSHRSSAINACSLVQAGAATAQTFERDETR